MIRLSVRDDMDGLIAHFSALMDYVRTSDGAARPLDQQQLLIDQLRKTLDRVAHGIETATDVSTPAFVAGTFAIHSLLYRGASYEVLKLQHRDLKSFHVLKTVRADQAAVPSSTFLLRREAEIGLALRDPYLVETNALLRLSDGRPGLLQPWSGESLSTLMRQQAFTVQDIKAIMQSLLLALMSLHRHGYVHCDISPSNIFIERAENFTLRLGDFGIALKTGQTHADLDLAAAYAPDYHAPEQSPEQPAHPSQDIYSAGRVLQHLLSLSTTDNASDLAKLGDVLCAPMSMDRPQTADRALALLQPL